MNILLINPWIYDFAAFDLWVKPLGLLYIGSFLERYGYRVSLIDCLDRNHPFIADKLCKSRDSVGKFYAEEIPKPAAVASIPRAFKRYGIPPALLEEDLKKTATPKLVIITSIMTYWYPGVFDTINVIKKIFPDVPILLGGIYATLCYEHAVKHSGADVVISGEGAMPILKYADLISKQSRRYEDISTAIDDIPFPAYHLYSKLTSVSMITSLGCPYNCTYCASRILHAGFTERSPECIYNEINYYIGTFRMKDIAFYDDAFLVNAPSRIIPLFNKLSKTTIDIRFHLPNGLHVRAITQEIADILYNNNFRTIRLSFESTSPWIQNNSSNKTTSSDLENACKHLKKAGYNSNQLEVYLLVGLPGQNKEEIISSIEFVHTLGMKIKIVQYSPIPRTIDYTNAVEQYGFIDSDPLLHNNSVFPFQMLAGGWQELWDIKNMTADLNARLT